MTKTERTQIEALSNKVDLLFSLISNEHLAKQALQVHSAITNQLEKDPDSEQLKNVVERALEAYKFHADSVNDSVKYYAQIHGDGAQKSLEACLNALPEDEPQEPSETTKG